MDDDFEWLPDVAPEEDNGANEQATTPRTRKKTKKRKEFVRWGTRELIEFLESIGKDTSKALSHLDVTNIVSQYITDNRLIHPEKKKRVVCDERLQALFGGKKQTVMRNKIHDLLEQHLLEHHVASEDENYSSDEKEEAPSAAAKRQKVSSSDNVLLAQKKGPEVPKSSLAAMCPENIKLVYLRRSLVQELAVDLETFEERVVGSFVRVKSDPYDIFQKNSHQLQVVTGVWHSAGDSKPPMLRLSGMTNDISISELSDGNFPEEECEDLHRRVKDGLLKQPTVGELEQKIVVLHELVTNNWLARELVLLKTLCDVALTKGLRYKVLEYRDRMRLLQTPEEKFRLLNEIPQVIPEKVEPEAVPADHPDDVHESINEYDDSPKAADWDREPPYQDGQASFDLGTTSNSQPPLLNREEVNQPLKIQVKTESNGHVKSLEPGETNNAATEAPRTDCNGHAESLSHSQNGILDSEVVKVECNGHLLQNPKGDAFPVNPERKDVEVITLSDDEEEPETPCRTEAALLPITERLDWFYLDPQRSVQGPFTLSSLKRWSDSEYFPADFKVWMRGQSPENAILLSHILQQIFRD